MIKMRNETIGTSNERGSEGKRIGSPLADRTRRKRAAAMAKEGALFALGWILGHGALPFAVRPFGLSLLCGSRGHTLAILAGLILSSVQTGEGAISAVIYVAVALVRIAYALLSDAEAVPSEPNDRLLRLRAVLFSGGAETEERKTFRVELRRLFSESIRLRLIVGSLAALIVSVSRAVVGGFRYYDLFAAGVLILSTPLVTLIFSFASDERPIPIVLRRLGEAALLFATIYSAGDLSFFRVPVAPMLALFAVLLIAKHRGLLQGVAAGVLCGLAFSPMMIPAFVFSALTEHFLQEDGKGKSAVPAGCFFCVAWAIYAGGVGSVFTILPAALIAGVATVPADFLIAAGKEATEEAPTDPTDGDGRRAAESHRYRDANERFRGISEAFSSLSEMFYNLSDRFRRPGTLDLRRICEGAFDAFCTDCPNKNVCWGLEYAETLSILDDMTAQLHTKGKVAKSKIPARLTARCTRTEGIVDRINADCARVTGEMLRNNRTEIFAMDYEGAAEIINDALEEDDGEYRFDEAQEKRIADYLTDAGVGFVGVTVYGNRRRKIHIRGVDLSRARVTEEILRADLGELCGSDLGDATFEVEGGVSTLVFSARKRISVIGAKNNVSADGGVSGDTVNLFCNKKNYFYALVSDGMGSGREAALTSNLCSAFLEQMLRAGNRAGTSLRMLHNLIRSRSADSSSECSSTVDLLELDLMSGSGTFIKSGAAPSFIIRGNVVHRLQAGTVPIGIISTLDAQKIDFPLLPGDLVVMVSDGILQSDPDCIGLVTYLKSAANLSPEEIVYHICLRASEGEEHDDCSAVALAILPATDIEEE